jgi:hypothetical protein
MEALRRLRRNSTDTNVDRRLVTNVLLSFLTTPRADPKRFEMLTLLASVLSWTDPEREKAGLQRAHAGLAAPSSFWGRSSTSSAPKNPELEKTDETEVCIFSALLVGVGRALTLNSVLLPSLGRVPAHRGFGGAVRPPYTVTFDAQHTHPVE